MVELTICEKKERNRNENGKIAERKSCEEEDEKRFLIAFFNISLFIVLRIIIIVGNIPFHFLLKFFSVILVESSHSDLISGYASLATPAKATPPK